MQGKIKLVIADDHELIRKGFTSLLEENSKIKVIGEASNGKELIELLKRIKPDIVLLDLEMPIMSGEEALKIITLRFPDVRVIMLSVHYSEALVTEFLKRGARAYLGKDANKDTLFNAIKDVKTKGQYFNQETSVAILKGLKKEKPISYNLGRLALTAREVEVLIILCQGKTNSETAEELHIAESTVDFHRRRIYKKTDSKTIRDLIFYALRNGLINL